MKAMLPLIILGGGVAAFVSRIPITRAQSAATPICLPVNNPNAPPQFTLTYDIAKGASLDWAVPGATTSYFSASLPKVVEGKPNPDFDRLYALLMKGIDGQLFSTVCMQGSTSNGATTGTLTSVALKPGAGGAQKVQICDGPRCAKVSDLGLLYTTN